MKKELLDTDRVNFLIWRFLIESNYRETAATLQKEWRVSQAPHRHFDFAPHVRSHALVTVLNKGLVYEEYERKFAASAHQAEAHDVPATAETTQRGVFGPLLFEPPVKCGGEEDVKSSDSEVDAAAELNSQPEAPPVYESIENPRKRAYDRQLHALLTNGSPAKRQRLSNGYENGVETATTPMEIDSHADNHAYPSPLEGDEVVSLPPRTEGPERGTQLDKVRELDQETIYLGLGAEEFSDASLVRAYQNPFVLHCEWSPQDPCILAAAGTDALARVWTITRATPTASDVQPNHVIGVTQHPCKNLLAPDIPPNAPVTAMAWNWLGTAIALAIEIGSKTRFGIWAADGSLLHTFDGPEPPVIKLLWSPNNENILGISPENDGTLVTVFSPNGSISYPLSDHDLIKDPLDAAWISQTEFILGGGSVLISLRCTDSNLVPGRKLVTNGDEGFVIVQFDSRSKLVATASDKGVIDLWDQMGHRRTIRAHEDLGLITSLKWQPLQAGATDEERLLASAGNDGKIRVWNVRDPGNAPRYVMSLDVPVTAISMTPDGAFIAGATAEAVYIWKMGDEHAPRATWIKPPHPGWLTPKGNDDAELEYLPSLTWNAEGHKLAYGYNSRLAVINFR